ncbi:hypothetical protein HDV02_005119 [Globomyces sp. JEL0801]|nr:hypothetical protein HDV02_005119 [Globomyces sp. JEL0801]
MLGATRQESFMDGYIASQQDQVFVNVEKDLQSYQTMIEALVHHSRDAKVFCLIHKMDLIQLEQRAKVFFKKLKYSKSQASFQTMEIRNPNMSIFVQPLTPNTYILVVLSNASIQSAIPIMNIQLSRKHFEEIEQQT